MDARRTLHPNGSNDDERKYKARKFATLRGMYDDEGQSASCTVGIRPFSDMKRRMRKIESFLPHSLRPRPFWRPRREKKRHSFSPSSFEGGLIRISSRPRAVFQERWGAPPDNTTYLERCPILISLPPSELQHVYTVHYIHTPVCKIQLVSHNGVQTGE